MAQLATNNPTVEIIHNTYKPVKEQKRKAFISSNLNVVMGKLIHQVRRLENNNKILICTDSQKPSSNKSSDTLESFTDVVDILDSQGILPNGFEIDPITREILEKASSKKQKKKLRVMRVEDFSYTSSEALTSGFNRKLFGTNPPINPRYRFHG